MLFQKLSASKKPQNPEWDADQIRSHLIKPKSIFRDFRVFRGLRL